MDDPELDIGNRTRTRMIRAAADLMQRRGYLGTGVNDILAHAQAPRGSLYHHFPGGKRQLAVEALNYTGKRFARDLDTTAANAPTLTAYLDEISVLSKRDLLATDFDAACPVAATALDVPSDHADLIGACDQAFRLWSRAIALALAGKGVAADRATPLADLILRSMLGATMAAKVSRDLEPIDATMTQLKMLVQ